MHVFTWSAEVQTLKAHLDKVPDIRQQQVDSLKQAMAEGRYQLYPQQIAAAMFADGGTISAEEAVVEAARANSASSIV
jgi:hypothetical protein